MNDIEIWIIDTGTAILLIPKNKVTNVGAFWYWHLCKPVLFFGFVAILSEIIH